MYKNTSKKSIKNPRLYYISNEPDEDLNNLEEYFKDTKPVFIDKVFKTKSTTKDFINIFINIRLNVELNEDDFEMLSEKLNKILNQKYKMFYTDANQKYIYTHQDVINNINDSLRLFINEG